MKTFVEIGTSDFNNLDHLLDEGWVGHFVEPIGFLMESLQKKIREQHSSKPVVAKFHQCAISDCNSQVTMKYVDPTADTWVQWVRGLSAVSDPTNNNGIDTRVWGKDCIKLVTVPCYTLDTFLDMANISSVDFMQIDVEGHELSILRNYSWKVKPKQIRIEHMWCGWAPIRLILERNGYECRIETEDIWGELKEIT